MRDILRIIIGIAIAIILAGIIIDRSPEGGFIDRTGDKIENARTEKSRGAASIKPNQIDTFVIKRVQYEGVQNDINPEYWPDKYLCMSASRVWFGGKTYVITAVDESEMRWWFRMNSLYHLRYGNTPVDMTKYEFKRIAILYKWTKKCEYVFEFDGYTLYCDLLKHSKKGKQS